MLHILINAFSFLLTILLGYGLKQVGIFKREDGQTVSKIFVYVTLPATFIVGMNGMSITAVTWGLIAIAIIINLILVFSGYFFGKKLSAKNRGLLMFTTSSFNIGGFTIPFVQLFMPEAIALVGMFDVGNAFMIIGGTPTMVDELVGEKKERFSIAKTVAKLLRSPIFVACFGMFTISLFNLSLPEGILPPLRFLATANSFLAMFTIGLFLRLELHKEGWSMVWKVLLTRYPLTITLAAVVYLFLPVSLFLRQILILCLLSPIGNLAIINAVDFGSDEGICGLSGSLSIIISLIMMSITMLFML